MNNKKDKEKNLAIEAIPFMIIMGLLIISINMISAQATVCCEKTLAGAWCQNEGEALCDDTFNIAPTSCDSTSFCKVGCCFDSQEGLCMENTPQRVCQDSGGSWNEQADCGIRQCNLGCCILGDQAALSTLTRCKSLSGHYGIETDFRSSITDENVCIATANAQDKGACVEEDPATASLTCEFTTRGECNAPAGQIIEGENITDTSKKFYADILCTAEELGTTCAPSTETIIIEGKDKIYFTDTCGNTANIYDAARYNDDLYWKNVYSPSESCGAGSSNAGSVSCGNCDYYLGSIGKKAGAFDNPTYGDHICFDLSCDGREHGESWCLEDPDAGDGKDRVGSRFYRGICLNNEKIIEPCADFRNEICIENGESFSEAACISNRWQSCTDQEDQEDCENLDARECKWIKGFYFSATQGILPSKNASDGRSKEIVKLCQQNPDIDPETCRGYTTPQGLCVPLNPPGFQFWGDSDATTSASSSTSTSGSVILGFVSKSFNLIGNVITGKQVEDEESTTDVASVAGNIGTLAETFSGGSSNTQQTGSQFSATQSNPFGTGAVRTSSSSSSEALCNLGDAKVTIKYKRSYESPANPFNWEKEDWDDACDENCEYRQEKGRKDWAKRMKEICGSLGDCGGSLNWIGETTSEGYAGYYQQIRFIGSGGAETLEQTESTTGSATATTTTGGVIKEMLNERYGEGDDE